MKMRFHSNRISGVTLIGRTLCLALFSAFLHQNAFAEMPRDPGRQSGQTMTHIQDLLPGMLQQSSNRSGDRSPNSDAIVVGAHRLDATAGDTCSPSAWAQPSPPLASLLIFSQYVTSRL
jgi:hypothetical protein